MVGSGPARWQVALRHLVSRWPPPPVLDQGAFPKDLCAMDGNAPQVPVESAVRVFSRQSVITQRELGQEIKVIYSFGMNPLSFYI